MKKAEDKARQVTVATYGCRICENLVIRHYFAGQGIEHDILGKNKLCMRCYLDGKYEPESLIQVGAPSPAPEGSKPK